MDSKPASPQRTYTEAELAALFTTYFGDRLTQSQLDSMVMTVAQAHAERRTRATESATPPLPAVSTQGAGSRLADQESVARFFGGWAPA
jgi:hypothetical protein